MTGNKPGYELASTKMQPPNQLPISLHYFIFLQAFMVKIGAKDIT